MAVPLALKIRAKKIGVLLLDARLSAGRTMKECAEAVGVTGHRIGTFERGENSPSLPELESIAFFLEVPLNTFWDAEALTSQKTFDASGIHSAITIRQRIIAAKLRMARLEAEIPKSEICEALGITTGVLRAYEHGERPIPLPELELLVRIYSLSMDDFRDQTGPAGRWSFEQQNIQQYLTLSPELQSFIAKPVNTPYLELAMKLSEMSADHLRAVAEGLLDITL